MNDKRDEVIEAARLYSENCDLYNEPIEAMADFALSREAELRRQIADDLDSVNTLLCSPAPSVGYRKLVKIIAELRGK